MVLTHTDVFTGIVYSTALANDDVTSLSELTTEQLNAQSLALSLTTVLRTTYTFLVCHFFFVLRVKQ